MPGCIVNFVVIDAEYADPPGVAPIPEICGPKKRAATLDVTINAVNPWKFGIESADGISGNLRADPLDRISDRRVAEHAEVECLVGVLPDVFAIDHQILAKRLREAGMKFIAVAGAQRQL